MFYLKRLIKQIKSEPGFFNVKIGNINQFYFVDLLILICANKRRRKEKQSK